MQVVCGTNTSPEWKVKRNNVDECALCESICSRARCEISTRHKMSSSVVAPENSSLMRKIHFLVPPAGLVTILPFSFFCLTTVSCSFDTTRMLERRLYSTALKKKNYRHIHRKKRKQYVVFEKVGVKSSSSSCTKTIFLTRLPYSSWNSYRQTSPPSPRLFLHTFTPPGRGGALYFINSHLHAKIHYANLLFLFTQACELTCGTNFSPHSSSFFTFLHHCC